MSLLRNLAITGATAIMVGVVVWPTPRPAPAWLPLDGQVRPAAVYPALAREVGDRFGGDGRTTFGLPDGLGHPLRPGPFFLGTPEGSRVLIQCVSTRRLPDGTEAGMLAWCLGPAS